MSRVARRRRSPGCTSRRRPASSRTTRSAARAPPGRRPATAAGRRRPTAPRCSARLTALAELLEAPQAAPALVVAAVAHGEVATLRPFVAANGVVARALARAVVVGRGLDPMGVVVWEAAHLDAGPRYGTALAAYASGTPDGVAHWLKHCAQAVVDGAGEGRAVCDAVLAGRLG